MTIYFLNAQYSISIILFSLKWWKSHAFIEPTITLEHICKNIVNIKTVDGDSELKDISQISKAKII